MGKKTEDPKRKEFIKAMLDEYKPTDANGVAEMLKDLFGSTLQGMLEAEMDDHLGYGRYERNGAGNARNGHSSKTVNTSLGEVEIEVPRDRNGEFEPNVVRKYQTDVSGIEEKVLSMYAKGMSTRDISCHLKDIYGVDASAELISSMTDRILPEAKAWQARRLDSKYIVMFLDAIHYSVRQESMVVKKAVYIAIGLRLNGTKEVLGMYVGGNESAKYWLGVLNDLKARGMEDVLITCVDGLTGFVDAISLVYPGTDVQRCIIHQMRSSTKFVVHKDLKAVVAALKDIYRSANQDEAHDRLLAFDESWKGKYPALSKSWHDNWSELTTFFSYPVPIRRLIYTTNMIEGFNRQLRKVTKAKSVFPNDDALFKMLYLAMKDITAKWTGKPHDWGLVLQQLHIMFPDRISMEDLLQ